LVLSDRDIKREMGKGAIRFTPQISPSQIGGASVDLHLSGEFFVFGKEHIGKKIDLQKTGFEKVTRKYAQSSITLSPGQMCLGKTQERITLPSNIMGFLEGRSRYARMGLAVHVTSALVQPGSDNHQVLEIVNMAPFSVTVKKGMCISQVVFEYLKTPTSKPYNKFGKIARRQ